MTLGKNGPCSAGPGPPESRGQNVQIIFCIPVVGVVEKNLQMQNGFHATLVFYMLTKISACRKLIFGVPRSYSGSGSGYFRCIFEKIW